MSLRRAWRRIGRPQIRVRTLLAGIALLAFCLSVTVNNVRRERRVIGDLRARGAFVSVRPIPTWPTLERLFGQRLGAWILRTLGSGYLERVAWIQLPPSLELAKAKSLSPRLHHEPEAPPGEDADLQRIASLPWTRGLHSVDLPCTRVTDTGLRHLASLRNLQHLELWGTDIDGRGLSHLAGLTELSWLSLDSTNITDSGLESLPRLPNLNFLFLKGTQITDAGIRHLSGLRRLMVLGLGETAVTGRGFQDFASGSSLFLTLSLAHCPVDDEGLRQVVSIPMLSELDLSRTRITDAGMEYLDELVRADDSACEVYVPCTSITDAGLLRLRRAKGKLLLHAGGTAVTKAGAAEVTRRHPRYTVCLDCYGCLEAAKTGEAMGPIR